MKDSGFPEKVEIVAKSEITYFVNYSAEHEIKKYHFERIECFYWSVFGFLVGRKDQGMENGNWRFFD